MSPPTSLLITCQKAGRRASSGSSVESKVAAWPWRSDVPRWLSQVSLVWLWLLHFTFTFLVPHYIFIELEAKFKIFITSFIAHTEQLKLVGFNGIQRATGRNKLSFLDFWKDWPTPTSKKMLTPLFRGELQCPENSSYLSDKTGMELKQFSAVKQCSVYT